MSEKYGKKVKEKMVQEMKEGAFGNKGFVVSSVENLKASEIGKLRKNMKRSGSRYMVLKNRLADIALKECGIEGLGSFAEEKKVLGVGIINDDPVQVVKMLKEFSKQNKGFSITAGYIEGRLVSAERVNELADMPSREQLLAMFLGTLNAPVTGFVCVMSGMLRSLLYALNAVKDKKGSE